MNREESPPRRRRRRPKQEDDLQRAAEVDGTDAAARALESSIGFFSKSIPIPFIANQSLPLAYPLVALAALPILPPVTWGLSVCLFSAYLALGTKVLDGGSAEDFNGNNFDESDGEQGEGENARTFLPLASFTGAFATAGLLSPQGLVPEGELPLLASSVGVFALGLGLMAFVSGIDELGKEERAWEEREREKGAAREEKRRIDLWDEELDNRFM